MIGVIILLALLLGFGFWVAVLALVLYAFLPVLEDPKPFFSRFTAAGVVRQQTLIEHPEVADAVAALTERLDNDTMSRLDQRVDVDGAEPALVAWEWLVEEEPVSAD